MVIIVFDSLCFAEINGLGVEVTCVNASSLRGTERALVCRVAQLANRDLAVGIGLYVNDGILAVEVVCSQDPALYKYAVFEQEIAFLFLCAGCVVVSLDRALELNVNRVEAKG